MGAVAVIVNKRTEQSLSVVAREDRAPQEAGNGRTVALKSCRDDERAVGEQGWGSLVGCRLWGRTESDTTEVT